MRKVFLLDAQFLNIAQKRTLKSAKLNLGEPQSMSIPVYTVYVPHDRFHGWDKKCVPK